MAAIKKVELDLSQQILNENVTQKPPIPGTVLQNRPSSGRFHNRGSLFKSTLNNKLLIPGTTPDNVKQNTETNTCTDIVLHKSANSDTANNTSTPRHGHAGTKFGNRRTQSAKARINHTPTNNSKQKEQNVKKSLNRRPFSANDKRIQNGKITGKLKHNNSWTSGGSECSDLDLDHQVSVIDLADSVMPDLIKNHWEKLSAMPAPRNMSFTEGHGEVLKPMCFSKPEVDRFEPSEEDCPKPEQLPPELVERLKPFVYGLNEQRQVYGSTPHITDGSESEQYPYKLTSSPTGASLSVSDKHQADDPKTHRCLPESLEPLRPWLTEDSALRDIIGVDPGKCLVFLPSLLDIDGPLPEVPPPAQNPTDDLPFIEDLTEPKPWHPKKHPHPFNKQPVEEWVCKHSRPASVDVPFDEEGWFKKKAYWSQQPKRSIEAVRQEIEELENLLKGIGREDSDCQMVLYQADINRLQNMLDETMAKIPERLRNPPPTPDQFGLRKFCKDHDQIIARIRQRYAECLEELHDLEVESGIETDRQRFRKTSSQPNMSVS